MNFTTQTYWEKYYSSNHTQKEHIVGVCSRYDTYWDLFIKEKGGSLLEIGGYPGRYLAYLSNRYDLVPTCLDFNSDISQIEASFKTMDVSNFSIIQEDFNLYQTETPFDYVLSNGFVEHFSDFYDVLDRHLNSLRPGGRLMIMIPNKRYLRKFYGYLVDYENLKAHNLNCMSLKTFEDFAFRNDLKIEKLEYFGGFPFGVHQRLNWVQKVIFKLFRYVFKFHLNPYLEKHPNKYLSSTIIGIFEKPY